jgi:hypothetical protein
MSKRRPKNAPTLTSSQWYDIITRGRQYPHTVPLCFRIVPGQAPALTLAPGVQVAVSPKEIERRFKAECVKTFFERYREAGGDTGRLETLLTCLLPVSVPKPPTRVTLSRSVRKAYGALQELLRLPGTLPGREVFHEAADVLQFLDARGWVAYLAQWKPEELTVFTFTVESATQAFEDYPYYPQSMVPAVGANRRGRIRSGSPTGLIIGVLAEECRRRFKKPRWSDVLAICCAIAPETFDIKLDTVERLQKRVERVPKDKITILFRQLFPAD